MLSKMEFLPPDRKHDTLCIGVTSGIHGDELNGIYICALLSEFFTALSQTSAKTALRAKIKIVSSVNPPGINNSVRFWPFDETDINRMFPGYDRGETSQRVAGAVFNELSDLTHLVDIHSSNMFVRESPQVRLYHHDKKTLTLARAFGLPVIWLREVTALETVHLSQTMSQAGKKTFVIQAGHALEIDKELCQNVARGILRWISALGGLDRTAITKFAPSTKSKNTQQRVCIAGKKNVVFLSAKTSGLFVAHDSIQFLKHKMVKKGELIGRIVDPVSGQTREQVNSPVSGLLFTIRVHPIVYQGSLLARIAASKNLPNRLIKKKTPTAAMRGRINGHTRRSIPNIWSTVIWNADSLARLMDTRFYEFLNPRDEDEQRPAG